ncbi:MAG: phospholipase D-like domain-containing protein, partial [Candidatus Nitrotoga sp.]
MCIQKIRFVSIAKFAAAFGLVLLLACTSIPTMVPDMAMHPAHPVQFDGAHGPLTAKQGKAILARLKKSGADTNIFDRHLALEAEIVGSPLVVSNKVELLVDGPSTYNSMFAAIEQANDHINMETYIIEDDEIGRHFIDLLISKQRSGVQVNLIYDSVGSISTPKEFFKPLQASGANVLEFNPVNPLLARKYWQVNRRDHRKLLIVDGQVAFVGGINISSVYSSGLSGRFKSTRGNLLWRDTHVRMAGPVVSEFQKLFMATWSEQNGPPLAARVYFPAPADKGNEVVRAIGSSPEETYS